jgi:hypothetical protein
MTFTARELRQRARDELRGVSRRREALVVATVRAYEVATRAREVARESDIAAAEAMAVAVVTFGGPDKAAAITGVPAGELRAARRAVPAERASEVADALGASLSTRSSYSKCMPEQGGSAARTDERHLSVQQTLRAKPLVAAPGVGTAGRLRRIPRSCACSRPR